MVGGKDAIVSLWRVGHVVKEGGFLSAGKKEESTVELTKLLTGYESSITAVAYEPSLQMVVCGDRKGTCYWRSVASGCLVALTSIPSVILPLVKESVKSFQFLKMHILSDNNTLILAKYRVHHKIQFILLKLRYDKELAHRIFVDEQLLSDFIVDETRNCLIVCHSNGFYCCSLDSFEVDPMLYCKV